MDSTSPTEEAKCQKWLGHVATDAHERRKDYPERD